jgi:hypothetical protein
MSHLNDLTPFAKNLRLNQGLEQGFLLVVIIEYKGVRVVNILRIFVGKLDRMVFRRHMKKRN